ncbi:MAG: hypothetical protein ACM34E_07800 [Acidobacteriota bacterium]
MISRKKHPTSRKSRRHVAAKRASAPKISRTRLRSLRDELDVARDAVTDTFHKFWIIPERDIRETLAATQQKIGRAVDMLKRAA